MDYAERIVKGHPRTEGMLSTLAGTALCAAVFVSGPVGPNIVPMAHEVSTIKPSTKPGHDDDFDCIPSRLINHPSGAIWGEEDRIDGSKSQTRLKKR